MKKLLLFLCFAPLLIAATCEDDDDDLTCRNANAGVRIIVRDAQTQENLTDLVVVISDTQSDYEETLQPVFEADTYRYYGAYGRPGSYALRVSKPGYQTYENNSTPLVVTPVDRCKVILAGRTVNLQPL